MAYISEVTVINVEQQQPATSKEVKKLIDEGLLFVNYYLDDDGKAFIDLKDATVGKFRLTK